MALTIELPVLELAPAVRAPSVGVPTIAAPNDAPVYVLKISDMFGANLVTIPKANVKNVTWELNTPDVATFSFAKGALDAGALKVLGNTDGPLEVQVFRDGDLLTWGPVVQLDARGSDGEIECTIAGPDWYLRRRFVDGIVENHLVNPDFETGDLTAWAAVGALSPDVTTDNQETGDYSARLYSAFGGDDYISQSVHMGPNGIGLLVILSGWFFIEAIAGSSLQSRGLYIEGRDLANVFQDNDYYAIDPATPAGQWTKGTCQVWIPPGVQWTIEARLYGPPGSILWDDIKLVSMDSLSTAGLTGSVNIGVDISRLIAYIVAHCQNEDAGKSDVHIGTTPTTIGKSIVKTYQFVDHVQFDQAIGEFVERDDGTDTWVELTPTTRSFRNSAHKKGTDRSGDITLRFVQGDDTSNCADYDLTRDGTAVVTRQTVIGDDNGPDRETGEQVETSALGGLILQDVYQAPQGASVDSLQFIADERVARFSRVPDHVTFHVKPDATFSGVPLVHVLKTGDVVAGLLDDFYVQLDENVRIQRISLDGITNVLAVTCATGDAL